MNETLPSHTSEALHTFYVAQALRILRRRPDAIVLEDPDTSNAAAGLPHVLSALHDSFGIAPPPLVAADLGFRTYYSLLGQMQDSGVEVKDTVINGGIIAKEQRAFLRRQLRSDAAPETLRQPFALLRQVLTQAASTRSDGSLYVLVVNDISLPEDPKPQLTSVFVRAAAPMGRRVSITTSEIFPAFGFWQGEVVGSQYDAPYVGRRFDNPTLYDAEDLIRQDQIIAARISQYGLADLPRILEEIGRRRHRTQATKEK